MRNWLGSITNYGMDPSVKPEGGRNYEPEGGENSKLEDEITSPIITQTQTAIASYFKNPTANTILPFDWSQGTIFQQRVWQALLRIPVGKTITYGQLAAQVKSHARAVGNACRRNPFPILVPCHRVVSQKGLGGYAGTTEGDLMEVKKALLMHEEEWIASSPNGSSQ